MTAVARRGALDEFLTRTRGALAVAGSPKDVVDVVRAFMDGVDPLSADRAVGAEEDKSLDLFDAIARWDVDRAKRLLRSGQDCVRWMVFGRASAVTGNTAVHSACERRAREDADADVDRTRAT